LFGPRRLHWLCFGFGIELRESNADDQFSKSEHQIDLSAAFVIGELNGRLLRELKQLVGLRIINTN